MIENSKLLDHASNSWVEKAVGNVRNMSSALLHELSKRLKHEIPVGHPLFSWAFIHACWIRNRFGVGAGVTSYELSRGHVYRGRLCQFAEPVMCFVGDTIQHKGYMAQERFDIQYATKTLASSLKDPTWKAWLNLGRLIGYLRYSETFALKVNKCEKGQSFMEAVLGVYGQRSRNNLQVFTDSDWAGAGGMKSTSAAIHTLNGLVIFSTSRSQKCISLSSTEAEWYSASSGVCDAMYLHYIVSFITDDDVDPLTLHVDDSAVKMLSLKQGWLADYDTSKADFFGCRVRLPVMNSGSNR